MIVACFKAKYVGTEPKVEHFNRTEKSKYLEIVPDYAIEHKLNLKPKSKQQSLTSLDYFLTTDSPAEHFVTEGEVALLLDPGSQSTNMNCAVVPQQAWVNGVMTSGRGY